jgi:hypothetical protein
MAGGIEQSALQGDFARLGEQAGFQALSTIRHDKLGGEGREAPLVRLQALWERWLSILFMMASARFTHR